MNLAAFAIRNRAFTLVTLIGLIVGGVVALGTIPKMEDPASLGNTWSIVAILPGASPTDMERLVVDPIERRVREVGDLKSVKTRVEDGLAVTIVETTPDVSPTDKHAAFVREIGALRADLPKELYRLDVIRWDVSDVVLVQMGLVSERTPYAQLEAQARRLKDEFSRVAGVKKAQIYGAPEREVRIEVDLARLAAARVPLGQLLLAIQGDNLSIPGGALEEGGRRFNVHTSGAYRSLDDVRETVIGGESGRVVRVRDVADVTWGYGERRHITRVNGTKALFVVAMARPNTNVIAVRDRLHAVADAFAKRLPADIALDRGFDQAANVETRLGKLSVDFGIAVLLVLVTLLPLGLRAAGIVMITIPLSLSIGIVLLAATGFTLNQLTIVGMVIALGLLVDDSIVVIENVARWMREGTPREGAAIVGTQQITKAVLGCTATLMLAFFPLLMLPGAAGVFIRSLPVTVLYTILASLVISLTIVPYLSARFLDDQGEHGNAVLRGMNRVIDLTYGRWLHRAIANPRTTLLCTAVIVAGSLALVPSIGFSLFPKAGVPQYLVQVDAPDGASLAVTDSAVRFAEQVLRERPEVRTVFSNVGRSNPLMYYNELPRYERASVGELFVLTAERSQRQASLDAEAVRARLDGYPGARLRVKEFQQGPPLEAPIAVRILGEDLDSLRAIAGRVEAVMRGTPGTRQIDNPVLARRVDLAVDVPPARAGLYGVAPVEVDRTVRLALAGLQLGMFRTDDGQEVPLTARMAKGGLLSRTLVPTVTGNAVPLSQVATISFTSGPALIQHYQGERTVLLTSDVAPGSNTDQVTKAILARLDSLPLPSGYRIQPAGEIESREESFAGLGAAALIAVFGILAILVLEFRNFRGTIIVASVIPLGIVGGLTFLWLSGYTLSFMAVIGFIALIGIEIKNSILLVDFTNRLRRYGMSVDEAVLQAGAQRFLPIVLTTLTAIGGLLPLAWQGSGLYSPLATVMIGGLVSSTLLARLVTPVVYKLLPPAIDLRDKTAEYVVPDPSQ